MSFTTAVWRCYCNILTFSGRARRAEYWWFILFTMMVQAALVIAAMSQPLFFTSFVEAMNDPQKAEVFFEQNANLLATLQWAAIAWLILIALPTLTVTVRRLHDTNRSGWNIFMPLVVSLISSVIGYVVMIGAAISASAGLGFIVVIALTVVPLVAQIWFYVWLALPGTHGDNRFGPDSAPDRKEKPPAHPAFAKPQSGEALREAEAERKAWAKDYYQTKVLPSIGKA